MPSSQYWLTAAVTAFVVVLCVVVHYEGLRLLTDQLPRPKHHQRRRIVLLILALLFMHIVEMWIFGDMYPVGPIRTMTGTEAITGLTLITWSASYTFVEMLKSWRPDD